MLAKTPYSTSLCSEVDLQCLWRPVCRATYGINYEQWLEDFKNHKDVPKSVRDTAEEELRDKIHLAPAPVSRWVVSDRFAPLVNKGTLMKCDQKTQAKETYICVHEETTIYLYKSTNDKALFIDGLCLARLRLARVFECFRRIVLFELPIHYSLSR